MKDYSIIIEKLMDRIITILEESYDYGYDQGYADAKSELGQNAIDLAHEESDRAYQQGLDDAWETAKKIKRMDIVEKDAIFAEIGKSTYSVIMGMSASEAIAKIKRYEEQQKQDTIQVGDEVYSEDLDWAFIVTKIITSKYMGNTIKRYEGICTDGACYDNLPKNIVKTGRHFDAIAEVLAEMRGEENDTR